MRVRDVASCFSSKPIGPPRPPPPPPPAGAVFLSASGAHLPVKSGLPCAITLTAQTTIAAVLSIAAARRIKTTPSTRRRPSAATERRLPLINAASAILEEPLLKAQCFDRIETRGLSGGVEP